MPSCFVDLSNFWKINTSSSDTQYYSIALTVNREEQCSTSHPVRCPRPSWSRWRRARTRTRGNLSLRPKILAALRIVMFAFTVHAIWKKWLHTSRDFDIFNVSRKGVSGQRLVRARRGSARPAHNTVQLAVKKSMVRCGAVYWSARHAQSRMWARSFGCE